MKKFFALLCVAAVVMVHVFNWILCGSDMALLDHTLMTVGLVAAGAIFVKIVRLYSWKETVSTSGSAMMLAAIALLTTEAMSTTWETAPEIYTQVLSAMPVVILLYGGSMFLWAEIYEGNFSSDVPITSAWVKTFAVLFTCLAALATLGIIDNFVCVPRFILGAVEVCTLLSAVLWIIMIGVFFWQSFQKN